MLRPDSAATPASRCTWPSQLHSSKDLGTEHLSQFVVFPTPAAATAVLADRNPRQRPRLRIILIHLRRTLAHETLIRRDIRGIFRPVQRILRGERHTERDMPGRGADAQTVTLDRPGFARPTLAPLRLLARRRPRRLITSPPHRSRHAWRRRPCEPPVHTPCVSYRVSCDTASEPAQSLSALTSAASPTLRHRRRRHRGGRKVAGARGTPGWPNHRGTERLRPTPSALAAAFPTRRHRRHRSNTLFVGFRALPANIDVVVIVELTVTIFGNKRFERREEHAQTPTRHCRAVSCFRSRFRS